MPFDDPTGSLSGRNLVRRDRVAVATWLFATAGMILVMVTLGGATRLTGSGLSIMEWAPLSGALPPWSEAEWQRLFALYRAVPQYALLHEGFGLEGFKHIFWLEWVHRLWGRLMGVVFLVPLLVFWARGSLTRHLLPRLLALFALGGLQGAVGWFMVASGFFPDSTAVSPYRLVIHLALALTLYAAVMWTGLSVLRQGAFRSAGPQRLLLATVALAATTIVAGGFVAGLHAGLTYNTFPLMDGRLVPEGYAMLTPWVRNLFENVAAVQFDHRLLATATAIVAEITVASLWHRRPFRPALAAVGGLVALQYLLGVSTLLAAVPVWLGTAHQAGAVLVLTAGLVALHLARHPSPVFKEVP
jgi:cytochrome c oxidase assembly protein subunit 15